MTQFRQAALICGMALSVAVSGCTPNNNVAVQESSAETAELEVAELETAIESDPQKGVKAANNSVQSSPIQVTDTGVGGLIKTTPSTTEAVQAAFPTMDVTTEVQMAEGMEYTVIVVSDNGDRQVEIDQTADGSQLYRVSAVGSQAVGASGHRMGDTFSEVYGETIPDSCLSGVDASSDLVLCLAPSSQNVQYAFSGGWDYAYGQLPPAAELREGVIEEIVWLPGNF